MKNTVIEERLVFLVCSLGLITQLCTQSPNMTPEVTVDAIPSGQLSNQSNHALSAQHDSKLPHQALKTMS